MDKEILEKDRNGRLTIKAKQLGCPGNLELANYIDNLEIKLSRKETQKECDAQCISKRNTQGGN